MDALERRGFQDGVDLRLGAIDTNYHEQKREGEKERERQLEKSQKQFKYIKIY